MVRVQGSWTWVDSNDEDCPQFSTLRENVAVFLLQGRFAVTFPILPKFKFVAFLRQQYIGHIITVYDMVIDIVWHAFF